MASRTEKKEPAKVIETPIGRLIYGSLFQRDIYKNPETGAEGAPSYKCEMAFNPDDVLGEGKLEDEVLACLDKAFYGGSGNPADGFSDALMDAWEGKNRNDIIRNPMLSGDRIAEDKARDGKGDKIVDAYKGKIIIRAHSQYNFRGEEAEGGTTVVDEEGKPISPVIQAAENIVWNGCQGLMLFTLKAYKDSRGDKSVTFYLIGFQKAGGDPEKDKLAGEKDNTKLFKPLKPVGRAPEASGGRRSRAG